MKKILTGFVFCLSITSCSLDTIPTSQYVEDNFWKTPEQIEAGLVACYSTMYNVYMYGSNLIFSETGTPNAYNYNGTYGWRVIGDGSVNSINSDIVNGKWGACYQGIGRCNTFIAGAPSFVISESFIGFVLFVALIYPIFLSPKDDLSRVSPVIATAVSVF